MDHNNILNGNEFIVGK